MLVSGQDDVTGLTETYPGARGFRPGKTHSYPPAVHREHTSSSGFVNVHFICAARDNTQSKNVMAVSGIPTQSTLMTQRTLSRRQRAHAPVRFAAAWRAARGRLRSGPTFPAAALAPFIPAGMPWAYWSSEKCDGSWMYPCACSGA